MSGPTVDKRRTVIYIRLLKCYCCTYITVIYSISKVLADCYYYILYCIVHLFSAQKTVHFTFLVQIFRAVTTTASVNRNNGVSHF